MLELVLDEKRQSEHRERPENLKTNVEPDCQSHHGHGPKPPNQTQNYTIS